VESAIDHSPARRSGPDLHQIPLAALSFLFHRTVRAAIRGLAAVHARRNPDLARRWRYPSTETIGRPLFLPVIMTTAPRWNTHAIVAAAGPLTVERALRVDAASANRSAAAWTVAIHAHPSNRLVTTIGAADSTDAAWREVALAPGRYRLALRYYHWRDAVELPSVEVDGAPAVAALAVPPDVNRFYDDLGRRRRWLYAWLHYYVFVLLRARGRVSEGWIRRELLPVGNPETEFYYGAVLAGERVRLRADPALLDGHSIYYTLYSRDSFPLEWQEVAGAEHTSAPAPEDGFYVVRVHRRDGGAAPFDRGRLAVTTI
jgi:hypothetical protein